MKTRQKTIIALILCFLIPPTTARQAEHSVLPSTVVAITANDKPFNQTTRIAKLLKRDGLTFTLHNLDAVSDFEQKYSQGLPANEAKARKQFEAHLKAIGRDAFEKELIAAYQGYAYMLRHQIQRYPVVIFDHQYAVYGVTDLNKALNHYQHMNKQ